jgi:site-specific recombinase XerD
LKDRNTGGYIFSKDGGKNPVSRCKVYQVFFAALEKIGINAEQRKERNLSMHGWRHFFNTTLLMANVSDSKVMSLTGHLTEESKKRYTHFDTTRFMEVVDVQEKLLATKRQRPKSAKAVKKPRKTGIVKNGG